MAYKNGTYIAFHADNTSQPTESDIKYFNLLKAWHVREESDFSFVDSHAKSRAVRDSSSKETLKNVLKERLQNSKNMILIIGDTTKEDTDWIPFEIAYAVDTCKIPIIAAYTGYKSILNPDYHTAKWPSALWSRITNKTAKIIHIPFKQKPLKAATSQFTINNLPSTSVSYYTKEAYVKWGLIEEEKPVLSPNLYSSLFGLSSPPPPLIFPFGNYFK